MLRKYLGVLAILAALFTGVTGTIAPAVAQTNGEVPGTALGIKSDTDLWRYVRTGNAGSTQMKGELSAVMIQSEGDNWRAFRNGPLSVYGAYGLAGIISLLVVFYLVRGRITIDAGPSEDRIMRFGTIDRFAHWLMAGSFVVLGITGLNLLYGRYVLLPILGKDAFATITTFGKYAHNYLAFAFMLGLGLSFILWVRHNIPNKLDLKWWNLCKRCSPAGAQIQRWPEDYFLGSNDWWPLGQYVRHCADVPIPDKHVCRNFCSAELSRFQFAN